MASAREIPPGKRRPYFFKVYFPNLSSERLGIPTGFWKHIEYKSSRYVSLTGPSGNLWNVDLIRNAGGMSFQNGWEDFVSDHSLTAGDFLIFRYDGDLHFTVQIFDATACEKEDAFFVLPCQEVTIIGERNTRKRAISKALVCSVENHSDERPRVHDNSLIKSMVNPGPRSSEQDSIIPYGGPSTLLDTLEQELNSCLPDNSNNLCRKRSRPALRRSLHKKPLSSSKYPHSEQSLLAHLNHLTRKKVKEEPQSEEAETSPCSRASTLQQQVVTKTKAERLPVSDNSHNTRGWNLRGKRQKHNKLAIKRPMHKKPINSSDRSRTKRTCHDHSRSLIREKATLYSESVEKKMRTGSAESHRRPITEEEKKKALEAANSFQSEHPLTLIIMRESYVYFGYYLTIPSYSVKHLPRSSRYIILWDPSGKSWKVRYNHRESQSGFSAGWVRFSRANNLEINDVCVFEHFKPNEMQVHIFRVVEEITPLIWGKTKRCS